MLKLIKKYIVGGILSDELPLNARLFNLIYGCGLIASTVSVLMTMRRGISHIAIIPELSVMMIMWATIVYCNKKRTFDTGSFINFALFFLILFPMMFFTNGATKGGMPMYFLLSIVISFLLLDGKILYVVVLMDIAVITICLVISYYHPEFVVFFESTKLEFYDIIQSIISCGLLIGIVIKFQTNIYSQEREKAIQASKAKADFIAGVSHELRTPLNAIIGLSEVELQKLLPKESKDNLERIYISGRNLLNIINGLLDISKVESGKMILMCEEYEIISLISDTANQNMIRIENKPIQFQVIARDDLPRKLLGDVVRIRQIINNLLSNAFKYTKDGKVTFHIGWEDAGNHIKLIFTISDTGIGILPGDMDKLFEEYSRINSSDTIFIEGTGLGLPICRNLANLMGGEINASSVFGEGSTFQAVIIQQVSDKTPIGKEAAKNLRELKFINKLKPKSLYIKYTNMSYAKVLVVDDVMTNIDVAKGLLKPYGIYVEGVLSGREAIQCIIEKEGVYDVIFMDHMMPILDGVETVHIIRNEIKSEYAKTVPIIALTANAMIGYEKMFLERGFQDYLSKPIDTMKLDNILRKWVRDKSKEYEKEKDPTHQVQEETIHIFDNLSIEGLDIKQGILNFSGDEESYRSILISFVQHTKPLLNELLEFKNSKQSIEKYQITVHGIKGSSYNIGANKMGRKAEVLEDAAIEGNYKLIESNTEEFVKESRALLSSIMENLDTETKEKLKFTIDELDQALLEKLLTASDNFEMDEMHNILWELEKTHSKEENELINWLKNKIEDFEYEAISTKLNELLNMK